MFYIGLFREDFFLSEITRPGAWIFGMQHQLVVFYHVGSNNGYGQKFCFVIFYRKLGIKQEKSLNFYSGPFLNLFKLLP